MPARCPRHALPIAALLLAGIGPAAALETIELVPVHATTANGAASAGAASPAPADAGELPLSEAGAAAAVLAAVGIGLYLFARRPTSG